MSEGHLQAIGWDRTHLLSPTETAHVQLWHCQNSLDEPSVTCNMLDLPQHTPLCSITWGSGIQHRHQTNPLLLRLYSTKSRASHRLARQPEPIATEETSRDRAEQQAAPIPNSATAQGSHFSVFSPPRCFTFFCCRTQSSGEGKPCCVLLPTPTAPSHLSQCRNPPTFRHTEQSCSPA